MKDAYYILTETEQKRDIARKVLLALGFDEREFLSNKRLIGVYTCNSSPISFQTLNIQRDGQEMTLGAFLDEYLKELAKPISFNLPAPTKYKVVTKDGSEYTLINPSETDLSVYDQRYSFAKNEVASLTKV